MTDKPTGVFVRLPLSEEQAHTFLKESSAAWDECNGSSDGLACESGLLAIGTPVTGGELAVVAYADPSDLPLNDGSECNWYTEVTGKTEDECTEGLVRQSDALALLAARDAEIARLREALDQIEIGIDALPDELECGDRMTAREMQRQALIIVKEEMKALKGGAA